MFVMRFLLWLLIPVIFSCSCLDSRSRSTASMQPLPETAFPDKKLQEIIIRGWYAPKDQKKQFGYSGKEYCYNRVIGKEPVFNRNLRACLYDKNGKILTEDFLRTEKCCRHRDDDPWTVTYLPYHDEGHEIRIVRLEKKKEVTIGNQSFILQSVLVKDTYVNNGINRKDRAYVFDEESKCHVAPGPG